MERLQKVIAAAGVASRRKAEDLIRTGRVTVNHNVVTELGVRVDPAQDRVEVDGTPLTRPAARTLALHKPGGYITTRKDPHARNTVMALVPDIPGLHPIGRLDQDTTGLLLLTNDGDLTFALTHPRHHVEKTYRARVAGVPTAGSLARLAKGVQLDDGLTAPAEARLVSHEDDASVVDLTIHEGKKRQVRRMLKAVGHPVLSLTRLRIGPLDLGDLPEGRWRDLTPAEEDALYAATGLARPTG